MRGTTSDPDLAALQSALSGLVPATTNVCTSGRTLDVPLKGPDSRGVFKLGVHYHKLGRRVLVRPRERPQVAQDLIARKNVHLAVRSYK